MAMAMRGAMQLVRVRGDGYAITARDSTDAQNAPITA